MDKSVNKIDRHFGKIQLNNFMQVPPLSPTQCCHNFPLILNVVQQHCVGGRGGGCFRQNTGIKLQFKLSQSQIKVLLTSYVHDCLSTDLKLINVFWPIFAIYCLNISTEHYIVLGQTVFHRFKMGCSLVYSLRVT